MDNGVGIEQVLEDYRQIFVERSKLISHDLFNKYVALAKQTNQQLEAILIEKSFISSSQYLQLSSDYFQIPSTPLSVSDINRETLQFLHGEDAEELLVIPFDFDKDTVKIAVSNPRAVDLGGKIHNPDELKVQFYITTEQAIRRALILYDPSIQRVLEKITYAKDHGQEEENVAVNELGISIIETAVMLEASDVHIEPYEDQVLIRLRIDGLLRQVGSIQTDVYKSLVVVDPLF
jgi:type IV pilus assembly protein PilB